MSKNISGQERVPILYKEQFYEALACMTETSAAIGSLVLPKVAQLMEVCFYGHTSDELKFLMRTLLNHGVSARLTNNKSLFVEADDGLTVGNQSTSVIGVCDVTGNKVTREHLGYSLYSVDNERFDELELHANGMSGVRENGLLCSLRSDVQDEPYIEFRQPGFGPAVIVVVDQSHLEPGVL